MPLLSCWFVRCFVLSPLPRERSRIQPRERGFIGFHKTKWFALIAHRPLPAATASDLSLGRGDLILTREAREMQKLHDLQRPEMTDSQDP